MGAVTLHRLDTAGHVREVLRVAEVRGASGRETRRLLRARFRTLSGVSVGSWYRAAVRVCGCLLLDLPDYRRPTLFSLGPRRKRTRRTKTANTTTNATRGA